MEKYIINQVKHIDWIICRLSTVYGSSPRMRFDLTVNDFTLKAVKDKYIDIFLPESYRPYVHVFDLANILMDLIDNFKNVKNNVFNVGFPGENYKKIAIAEYAKNIVKDLKIDILKEGGDNRDYKVDFSKLNKHLKIDKKYNVYKSMIEISQLLKNGIIDDPLNHQYYNTSPSLE